MTLTPSGQLAFSQINTELGRSANAEMSIESAENGTYATINPYSPSKPSATNPATVSEWYSYNHAATTTVACYSFSVQVMSTVYDCCGTPDTTKYSNCSTLATNCYIYNSSNCTSAFTYSVFFDGTYIWTANNGSGQIDGQYSCTC